MFRGNSCEIESIQAHGLFVKQTNKQSGVTNGRWGQKLEVGRNFKLSA